MVALQSHNEDNGVTEQLERSRTVDLAEHCRSAQVVVVFPSDP